MKPCISTVYSRIRKGILHALIPFLTLAGAGNEVQASHSMGSDLTYRCLGGNQYELTLSFYRDCAGIPADSFAWINITSSCFPSGSVTLQLVPGTGQEITPLCPSQVSTCNGGTFTGVQEYVYKGIVNLPGPCADWSFDYYLCCRNMAITNLDFPASTSMYVFATLNNLVANCNNSPTFSNRPVPFVCMGQQYCYNHGAFDPDGDSLVYTLMTPMDSPNFPVQYSTSFSATNPLTSIPALSFNPVTGDICMTPVNPEVTVMAVLVQEYRNGVLIGSVERDIQITVISCTNQLPVVSGINGTNNFTASVCAGNQLCFNISSADNDASQNTFINWDESIPGATFTITPGPRQSARFCWTPGQADLGSTRCFTVTIQDDNCPFLGSQVFSYCINVSGISADAGPDLSVGCNSNATVTATASGGSGTYNYNWNNGLSGPALTGGPGTYIVTVSDGSCSDKDTVQILAGPNTPTAAFSMTYDCSGLNVQFTNQSTIAGGSISAYTWNFGDGNTTSSISPSHTYSSTGNYQVMLIAQGTGGCMDTVVQTLNLTNDQPLADFSLHNACVGDQVNFTDQSSSISALTVFSWDFGDASGASISNPGHTYLNPGTYQVKLYIENANACADSITKQLTVYPLPTASAGNDLSLCEGDTVQLNGNGGISQTWNPGNQAGASISISPLSSITYTLSVSDINGCIGEDLISLTVNPRPVLNPMPDQDICVGESATLIPNPSGASSLSWMPGGSTGSQLSVSPLIHTTYYLTATSNAGCISRDTVSVFVNTLPVLSLNATDAACSGAQDGEAEVQVLSGASPYQYNWTPSGGISALAGGLGAGTYSVTVTDSKGCSETGSVVISEPQPIVISESTTSASCFGSVDGSATVSVSGGIPGYNYTWNTGGSTSASLSGIAAGNYMVTVQDANGCTESKSIFVAEPSAISLLSTSSGALCHGTNTGSAGVIASGGTPSYTYNWTGLSSTSSTVSGLAAGTYAVTVSDNHGCTSTASILVTEPGPIQLTTSSNPASCSTVGNGSATISASGGTGTFSYQWSPSGGTNAVAPGLVPGTYHVMVTDVNGCTSDTSVIVNSIGGPQISPVSINDVSCFGGNDGSALIAVNSGTAPYTIQWSPSVSSGTNATNLVAGTYTVSVSDNNGCLATHQLVITQPDQLASSFLKNDVSCFGQNTGSIEVRAAGGTQPYTYSWTPNLGGTSHPLNLPAGNYTVMITDGNSCTNSISINITEPAALSAQVSVSDLNCHGDSSGAISVLASGGTPSYSYVWSPGGSTGAALNGIGGGTYQVRVTDNLGCTFSLTALVTEPDPLLLRIDPVNTICIGQSAGLHAQLSGGVPPYTYLWNTGLSDSSISVNPTDTSIYSLQAWDANACPSATVSTLVPVFPPLNVLASGVQVICEGDVTYVSALASGGNGGPYTYSWNQQAASGDSISVFPEQDSLFIVFVSDGCGTPSASDSTYVLVHPLPDVVFLPHFIEGCTPVNAVFQNLSEAPAATAYLWSFGNGQYTSEKDPVHLYTEPGLYDVSLSVTSPEGCEASLIIPDAVRVYAYPSAAFSQSAHETSVLNPGISFYDESENAVYIEWDFGDGSPPSFEQNPHHEFPDSGTYVIRQIVSGAGGCFDTIYSTVRVEMEFIIHVPNAFSPNGDGINDGFIAKGIGYSEYSMWILDRWGTKIFNSNDREKPWDGTFFNNGNQCQADVYEWVLDVLDYKGKTHRLIGHVTLIR